MARPTGEGTTGMDAGRMPTSALGLRQSGQWWLSP